MTNALLRDKGEVHCREPRPSRRRRTLLMDREEKPIPASAGKNYAPWSQRNERPWDVFPWSSILLLRRIKPAQVGRGTLRRDRRRHRTRPIGDGRKPECSQPWCRLARFPDGAPAGWGEDSSLVCVSCFPSEVGTDARIVRAGPSPQYRTEIKSGRPCSGDGGTRRSNASKTSASDRERRIGAGRPDLQRVRFPKNL